MNPLARGDNFHSDLWVKQTLIPLYDDISKTNSCKSIEFFPISLKELMNKSVVPIRRITESQTGCLETALAKDVEFLTKNRIAVYALKALIVKTVLFVSNLIRALGSLVVLDHRSSKLYLYHAVRNLIEIGAKFYMLVDPKEGLRIVTWNYLCKKENEIVHTRDDKVSQSFKNTSWTQFFHKSQSIKTLKPAKQNETQREILISVDDAEKISSFETWSHVDQTAIPHSDPVEFIKNNSILYRNLQSMNPNEVSTEGFKTLWEMRRYQIELTGKCDEVPFHLLSLEMPKDPSLEFLLLKAQDLIARAPHSHNGLTRISLDESNLTQRVGYADKYLISPYEAKAAFKLQKELKGLLQNLQEGKYRDFLANLNNQLLQGGTL